MSVVRRAASVAATAVLAFVAPPAAAQPAFEGVITMRMTAEGTPEPMTMRYLVRQGRMRSEIDARGMSMATIIDPAKREAYVVMPGQRMYMVMPLDAADAEAARGVAVTPEITRTGRRETIAGHACEHYLVKVEQETMDMCLATDMPAMALAGGGMSGAARAGQAAWQRALGRQAGFPLKVTRVGATGSVLEVTRIEATPLDAALFEVPAGYQRMQMPGMPRRP